MLKEDVSLPPFTFYMVKSTYLAYLLRSECTVYTHLDRIYCQVLFKNTFSCFWSFIYYCFIFFIEKKYLKHQLRGLHVHCALYWFVFHCNNKLILFLNCVCVCFFSLVKFLLNLFQWIDSSSSSFVRFILGTGDKGGGGGSGGSGTRHPFKGA